MDALAFLPVLNPVTVIVAPVVALPSTLPVLQTLFPLTDIDLLIEPTELTMTLPITIDVASFVHPLASRLNAFCLETVSELTLID